jgi:hypothetical protein
VHKIQIDRLIATVPDEIDERQRSRLHAYEETARTCELRIQRLRADLERTVRDADGADDARDTDPTEPNAVLLIACELDTLEQVQPRVDGWLKEYVNRLVQHTTQPYSAAESYGDA